MKFIVPILIFHGPGHRKVRAAKATFSARSIHEARAIIAEGVFGGATHDKVRVVRAK